MQEEDLEQEAVLAKAEQAAQSETLRDTAPVIDANKVPSPQLLQELVSGHHRLNKNKLPYILNTNSEIHHLGLYDKTY